MTYKQAYDKIIEAYFKDEIKPYAGEFCFCGTLAGFSRSDKDDGKTFRGWFTKFYSRENLTEMEGALLETILTEIGGNGTMYHPFKKDNTDEREKTINHPKYEDALFAGMCAALDVLKQIHKERGEDVDDVQVFEKRKINQ